MSMISHDGFNLCKDKINRYTYQEHSLVTCKSWRFDSYRKTRICLNAKVNKIRIISEKVSEKEDN